MRLRQLIDTCSYQLTMAQAQYLHICQFVHQVSPQFVLYLCLRKNMLAILISRPDEIYCETSTG